MASDADDAPGTAGASGRDAEAGRPPAAAADRPGEGGPETALVTGCSSAVGRATALAFREEGWRVYATAPDEAALDGLADRGCLTDGLDVTRDRDVRRVVKRAATEAGRIDCLATVPGCGRFGPVEAVPIGDVREGFDRAVFGPYRLIQRVLPHMRERGEGTVVAVSSVLGRVAAPGTGPPSGAAAAVEAMGDALRVEVAADGVDVVLVEPALVDAGRGGRCADGGSGHGADRSGGDSDAGAWPGDAFPGEYDRVAELLANVRALADGGPGAVPPERVAAAVVNAASATMPAPRYPVGALASLLVRARYLPDTWRDAAFRLALRLA